MSYVVTIKGFEGRNVELQPGGLFSGPKLLVDGQPAPAGPRRGEMILRRADGTESIATWKQQGMGLDVPQLVVDGAVVKVVEPLPWYVWLWCALPLVLIVLGGLLGGLAGAAATYVNLKLFRTSLPVALKFILAAVVGGVAAVVYLLVALTVMSAMSG